MSQSADPPQPSVSETLVSSVPKSPDTAPARKSVNGTSLSLPRTTLMEGPGLEDGPLFRATIAQLESRTSALRMQLKRILKAASASLDAKKEALEADEQFVQALRETPCVEPLMSHYLNNIWPSSREQRENLQQSMQSLIDSLKKMYTEDVKVAETKRKTFEEKSKEYYAYLAKYLSIKKSEKSAESDAKHLEKKREFDLDRFDYYAFLVDLHGGKKEQDLLHHLLSYYQKQHDFQQTLADTVGSSKSGLDELAALMADVSREQDALCKERKEKRKILEGKSTEKGGTQVQPEQHGASPPVALDDSAAATTATETVGLGITPATEDRFRGIRDLEQQDRDLIVGSGRRKEGFLFATSKPIKNNTNAFEKASSTVWHKYWCVLSGGQLHEYSNWKSQLQTHMVPINLRFAAAREARSSERRFCFEIITPQFRRVYQATSQEEMQSWVATVNNAIESLLNGMSSSIELVNQSEQDPVQQQRLQEALAQKPSRRHTNALSDALRHSTTMEKLSKKRQSHGPADTLETPNTGHSSTESRFRWSGLSFGKANAPSQAFTFSPIPDTATNTRLISQLRQDPSNTLCADCGSANPDWCSLNLGILLCIECSGIHRSLGTHISKVRSLTLDSASYTPDIVALLLSIGNARANIVWDPISARRDSTDTPQVKPDDGRDVKRKYIQAKYVERAFVTPLENIDAQDMLFDAIERDDIPDAMHALALGANVNGSRESTIHPATTTKSAASVLTPPNMSPNTLHTFIAADSFLWRLEDDDHITMDSDLEDMTRYPLHVALLHSRISSDTEERDRVFPMAEFLLQNGADAGIQDPSTGCTLAELVGQSSMVEDEAIEYLNMKSTARGQSPVARASMPPSIRLQSDTASTDNAQY